MGKFDRNIRKEKFPVLGKSDLQSQRRNTAAQRAYSFREKTIGRDIQRRHTASTFVDDRFRKDSPITRRESNGLDKKILRKLKRVQKGNRYDLDSSHQIEDDDTFGSLKTEIRGKRGRKFETEEGERKKTSKEVYNEIIQKSKNERLRRRIEKEANEGATERLDEKWSDLTQEVTFSEYVRENRSDVKSSKEGSEYDDVYKSLIFDSIQKATRSELTNEEIVARRLIDFERMKQGRRILTADGGDVPVEGDLKEKMNNLEAEELQDLIESEEKRIGFNKEEIDRRIPEFFEYFLSLLDSEEASAEKTKDHIQTLFYLCQVSPDTMGLAFRKEIATRYRDMHDTINEGHELSEICTPGTLLLFKVVPLLFPASDFSHSIVTPVLLVCCELLAKARTYTIKDIVTGLFVATLVKSMITERDVFAPELYRYLYLVISTLSRNKPEETGKEEDILFPVTGDSVRKGKWLAGDYHSEVHIEKVEFSLLMRDSEDDVFDSQTLRTSLISISYMLLEGYIEQCSKLLNFEEMFGPMMNLLQRVNEGKLPKQVKQRHARIISRMQELSATTERKEFLHKPKKRFELKMMNPKFEESHIAAGRGKKQKEGSKLKASVKKEFRGTLRDIRKDAQYYQRKNFEEKLKSKKGQKRSYGEIMHMLEDQQHDKNLQMKKRRTK